MRRCVCERIYFQQLFQRWKKKSLREKQGIDNRRMNDSGLCQRKYALFEQSEHRVNIDLKLLGTKEFIMFEESNLTIATIQIFRATKTIGSKSAFE